MITTHKASAFTLIELMVVVMIISVLASLLGPALKDSRDKAHAVSCINNVRQLGLAMNLYGESTGYYPWAVIQDAGIYAVRPNYDGDVNSTWAFALNSYLGGPKLDWGLPDKRSRVLVCPMDPIKYKTNLVTSYGVHAKIFGNTFEGTQASEPWYPRRYPFEERPGELIMLGDVSHASWEFPMDGHREFTCPDMYMAYNPATANNLQTPYNPADDSDIGFKVVRFRHHGYANFVFMDGHVEALNQNKFLERNIRTSSN